MQFHVCFPFIVLGTLQNYYIFQKLSTFTSKYLLAHQLANTAPQLCLLTIYKATHYKKLAIISHVLSIRISYLLACYLA